MLWELPPVLPAEHHQCAGERHCSHKALVRLITKGHFSISQSRRYLPSWKTVFLEAGNDALSLHGMQSLRTTFISLLKRPSGQTISFPISSKFPRGSSPFTKLISPPHVNNLAQLQINFETKRLALQTHNPQDIFYQQASLALETLLQLHGHCRNFILLPEAHALHGWGHWHPSCSPDGTLGTGSNMNVYRHQSMVIHKLYKSKCLQASMLLLLGLVAQHQLPCRVLMEKQPCAGSIFPSLT